MDKLKIQRLKSTLAYLKSKQRELTRVETTNTRILESMIKYLKKDMLDQFKLAEYDIYIKNEIKDTDTFIKSVQNIIDEHCIVS
jgi:hypothetical protein